MIKGDKKGEHCAWVEFCKTDDAQEAADKYAGYVESYGRDGVLFTQDIYVEISVDIDVKGLNIAATTGE